MPREEWYHQCDGEDLDDDLSLKRDIRPVTGATLTARATTEAVRRVLAIHQVGTLLSRSLNQSEIKASAAVIRGSQLSAAALNSWSAAAGRRQRRVSSSSGTIAESRADSTSADVGAAAT